MDAPEARRWVEHGGKPLLLAFAPNRIPQITMIEELPKVRIPERTEGLQEYHSAQHDRGSEPVG